MLSATPLILGAILFLGTYCDRMSSIEFPEHTAQRSRPLISFILPVFNEAESIVTFHRRLRDALSTAALPVDFEFVYVDDGSRDESALWIERMAETDPDVELLQFSRNFGHQIAVTAGIDAAHGDAAVIMDTDLQDPPTVAVRMIQRWLGGEWDVIYAQRASRRDSMFKKVTAAAFYRLLHLLADIDIPRNTGDFRLIDRRVIDALQRFPERTRFLRGIVSWVGFRQSPEMFDRDERYAGKSGYPLKKMIGFATDGILGFSMMPLRLVSLVGWCISGVAALAILYILMRRVFDLHTTVPGWSATVITILGVAGVQIIMLSVLGSYLGRVYSGGARQAALPDRAPHHIERV